MNTVKPRLATGLGLLTLLSLWIAPAAGQISPEAAQSDIGSDANQTVIEPDDPWASVAPTMPETESPTLLRRKTPDTSPVLVGKQENKTRPLTRTLGALAGVVGLIVFLAWGYRAMAGGRLPLLAKARRPGLIEVISRTSLTPRQTLSLVRIGPRMILIGQTPDSLRALDVIEDADLTARLAGEAARIRGDSNSAEFNACLEREAEGYDNQEKLPDEMVTPEARRLTDAHRGLKETIKRIQQATRRV